LSEQFPDAILEAYLDEALPIGQMASVEAALRGSDELKKRLSHINERRDAGLHTLGEIWRRHRLSCPTREQLGSYLLGVLGDDEAQYIRFHLDTIECRFCAASLDDLKQQQAAGDEPQRSGRRTRYFQSSMHYLREED
jgi:hypothetical protein